MNRPALVQIKMPKSIQDLQPQAGGGYKVLDSISNFVNITWALPNNKHHVNFLDKFLSHHLLYSGSGKALYQLSLQLSKENGMRGAEWYELYRDRFHPLSETDLAWTRMNRAIYRVILMEVPVEEAAEKFEVNSSELELLIAWYWDRFTHLGDLTEVISDPSGKSHLITDDNGNKVELLQMRACWNIGESPEQWWDGVVIDEHSRYIDLRQPIIEHASRRLAGPSFKYLADIYEDRAVILEELFEIAWPAILVTSHREDSVESLKMAKSYINTRIHHLATRYTKDLKKQEWNEQSQTFESMEIPLFSDPDMDPSKHLCLTYDEEGFELQHLLMSMERHLTPKEYAVVAALMGINQDKDFEAFAKSQPDRRLAAFEFYEVHESQLRQLLAPFLGQVAWGSTIFAQFSR